MYLAFCHVVPIRDWHAFAAASNAPITGPVTPPEGSFSQSRTVTPPPHDVSRSVALTLATVAAASECDARRSSWKSTYSNALV